MTEMPRRNPVAMLWTGGSETRVGRARGIALIVSLLMIDSLHYVFARLVFPTSIRGLAPST